MPRKPTNEEWREKLLILVYRLEQRASDPTISLPPYGFSEVETEIKTLVKTDGVTQGAEFWTGRFKHNIANGVMEFVIDYLYLARDKRKPWNEEDGDINKIKVNASGTKTDERYIRRPLAKPTGWIYEISNDNVKDWKGFHTGELPPPVF